MTATLTAADYVYRDRIAEKVQATKELIAAWARPWAAYSDLDKGPHGRPGIPGTVKALDKRVQETLTRRTLTTSYRGWRAAATIEAKVLEAYKLNC